MDSLLDRDRQQLELIPSESIPSSRLQTAEGNHAFSGARLFRRDPETYRLIVSLRAEGVHKAEIARQLGVSRSTIRAVERREQNSESVDQMKKRLSRQCIVVGAMVLDEMYERLHEEPGKIPANVLPAWLGVPIEKGELLAGRPTARTEVADPTPAADAYHALLRALRTGLSGGYPETKRAEGDPGRAPYERQDESESDRESMVINVTEGEE
jgi:hypothetical protein